MPTAHWLCKYMYSVNWQLFRLMFEKCWCPCIFRHTMHKCPSYKTLAQTERPASQHTTYQSTHSTALDVHVQMTKNSLKLNITMKFAINLGHNNQMCKQIQHKSPQTTHTCTLSLSHSELALQCSCSSVKALVDWFVHASKQIYVTKYARKL